LIYHRPKSAPPPNHSPTRIITNAQPKDIARHKVTVQTGSGKALAERADYCL
jgi:hypothetical protein